MSSSLKIASNANSTKPTSVCAVKNDKQLSSTTSNNSSSTTSSSKRNKQTTIITTKPTPNRPNSILLTDSKAFEYNPNCTVSNSTSQASLHFTKNSLSSPATENPTDSVFTMYQKSNRNSTAALSVADVKFIDETATTAANINRNNSNNQKNSNYSNRNPSTNNKYSSPELTPTTNLFPIFSQLESTVKSQTEKNQVRNNKIIATPPESPKKHHSSKNNNSNLSRKALQDKLSSLPREFSDSSISSEDAELAATTDVNNNNITTIFRYEPENNIKNKTQTSYKKITKTQVQSSKLQQKSQAAATTTNSSTVLSSNTLADRKSDRNNQKCLYSLQKSSTPRYDLAEAEGDEETETKTAEKDISRETANSLEALYEPNLDKNRNNNNDDNENTINKYATFPRKISASKSNTVSKKQQVWEKRKTGDIIPKTINAPKTTQSLKRQSRSEASHYTPEISRLKIKFTKTPQATNHALSASSSTSANPAKQPLISSFKPYQSHSRNSSLESGVTLLKFKSDYNSQTSGLHQGRVATPTGTLDSALSGSHNVIFQDKDDDDGKHSRNLIVFFGLICFIIGLVLVFLMLLRRKNS